MRNVSKTYRLFATPGQRLRESLRLRRAPLHREFAALDDISFTVGRGQSVGILGRNGSGKSTLLQIIGRVLAPTRGTVETQGRIAALLQLGAGFNPEFTGRENVVLQGTIAGLARGEMLARLPAIEAFAQIGDFIDQPVKLYSSGMFVRLAFAAAMSIDPDILLVDEALAVGDARFQQKCFALFEELKRRGKTILFVSHSMETVINVSDWAMLLESGRLVASGRPRDIADRYIELLYKDAPFPRAPRSAAAAPVSVTPTEGDDATARFLAEPLVEDRCPQRSGYNPHERATGNGQAEIVDFLVIADGRPAPPILRSGTPVEIYVKVALQPATPPLAFGFAMRTKEGVYVYGANQRMRPQAFKEIRREGNVVFKFSLRLALATGHYFIDLAAADLGGKDPVYLHMRRQVLHVTITDGGGFDGVVDLMA